MKNNILYFLSFLSILVFFSCKKQFLEKKPDKALLVPTTLTDFQSLLDAADNVMYYVPGIQFVSSDEFYITTDGWNGLGTEIEKNSYNWVPDIYQGRSLEDWNRPYKQVFYANIVLEGLSKITPDASTQMQWNQVKGSALFYRAYAFYQLAQLFAAPYNATTADQNLGIPIRLSPDVNIKVKRGTLQQTYDQILSDLHEAQSLLPVTTIYITRPSQVALFAFQSRIYQTMQIYDKAKLSADASLAIYNTLLDYNTLNPGAPRPFPRALHNGSNKEILFYSEPLSYGYRRNALTFVDTILYSSYSSNDLRKTIFFSNAGNFKGSYTGQSTLFNGIAVDEIYLTRAECFARLGQTAAAMDDLNTLLVRRWKSGTFVPFTATNANDALNQILMERKKELITRGLRWTDLRRLNQDPNFAVTLKRIINGQTYTLPPNDKKYVFAIPENEILSSGLEQNPR